MERRLVTPKTMRSGVWEHFGFEGNEDGEIVSRKSVWCRHCQSRLAYSGNTTNMSVHLAKCRQYTSPTSPKSITDTVNPKRKVIASPAQNVSNVTSALLKYIIANMENAGLVENKEFCELMGTICKDYQMPCSRTICSLISCMADDTKKIIFDELQAVQHVCLTAEIWTSITMENYLGVTCHFLDMNWELQARVLVPENLPSSYTCENVANLFVAIEKKWCLTDKVMAYVTDDVPHIVNAVEILMESQRLSCLAHSLQQSVNASLERVQDVNELVGRCRKIVEHFNHNPLTIVELDDAQQKHGLPSKTLVKDIETRWMSSYDMLICISEQQKAINSVLKESDETKHLALKNNDLQKLEAICNVFEPLVEATTYLGGEKYACASIVLPIFYNLRKALDIKTDPWYIRELKTTLANELSERQKNLGPLLVMASALDPRFKSLKFLSEEERKDVWNALENELVEYIALSTTAAANLTEHFNNQTTKSNRSTSPKKKKLKLIDDSDDDEDEDTIRNEDIAAKEIQTYRAQKKVDCEPTVWWRINAATHPNLAHMAKKYLSLVATSTQSERLFSSAGYLWTKKRESLAGMGVKELLFLHSYQKKTETSNQESLIPMEIAVLPCITYNL